MNIDDITIKQAKELATMFGTVAAPTEVAPHPYTGKKVLVRTYASGVHIGTLSSYCASTRSIFLKDSQRIHYWEGAFTLSAVATEGITAGRISCVLPELYVEQVEEMTVLTTRALESIAAVGVHSV